MRIENDQKHTSLLVRNRQKTGVLQRGGRQPELEGGDGAVWQIFDGRGERQPRPRDLPVALPRVDGQLNRHCLTETAGQAVDDLPGEAGYLRARRRRRDGHLVGAKGRRDRQSQQNLSGASRHESGKDPLRAMNCLSALRRVKPHAAAEYLQ